MWGLFRKTFEPVEQVIKDSGMINKIHEVVLVGGSTRYKFKIINRLF